MEILRVPTGDKPAPATHPFPNRSQIDRNLTDLLASFTQRRAMRPGLPGSGHRTTVDHLLLAHVRGE
jgi:hypothetical protein